MKKPLRDLAAFLFDLKSRYGGHFMETVLHPQVTVKDASMVEKANVLHPKPHELCFIANSANFEVTCEPHCSA